MIIAGNGRSNMHAIIRQGEGKYYVSAVFGYYKDITATRLKCAMDEVD